MSEDITHVKNQFLRLIAQEPSPPSLCSANLPFTVGLLAIVSEI